MAAAGTLAREVLRRLRNPLQAARTAWLVVGGLRTGGLAAVRRILDDGVKTPQLIGQRAYEEWVARHDTADGEDLARMRAEAASLGEAPLISILMPVYETPAPILEQAIESVLAQVYPNWQLCIADDASQSPHIAETLRRFQARDGRIDVLFRPQNGRIAQATNSAFGLARGEWVALLDHDDLLAPHALLEVARTIDRHPDVQIVYSDEDKIDAGGRRFDPFFKPGFSPELLRSMNLFNHLTVHRAANVSAVGGWRPAFDGSQDYDLNLRIVERVDGGGIVHIPKILYHWRAAAGSVAAAPEEKSYAFEAGARALSEHCARVGIQARITGIAGTPYYRTHRPLADPPPLVSLVIPTRDGEPILRRCIASIRERTRYKAVEIIVVDNGSSDPAALGYLKELEATGAARVLSYDAAFNYSAINNLGVRAARGTIVGLLNNDIEAISPDWLDEMVPLAADEAVGCVGAKLRYADGSIQHAGIVLGIGGVAGHAHKHAGADERGYFGRLAVTQGVSAVTGACLLVRKAVYEEVGGLNGTDLAVAFNDVDFCLRVAEAGYRNVFTPFAELYHLESATRGPEDDPEKRARFASETAYMRRRWGALLDADPHYSPNLTLLAENLSLADPPRVACR